MNNDNAETPLNNSLKAEVAATGSRQLNQSHDAADHSQNISETILTTLAEWRRADHAARRPESTTAATRPHALQPYGRFYARAMPSSFTAAFDATHITRDDKISPRPY
jgi:hypothetical protein